MIDRVNCIYVAGHNGMVGSAIIRHLNSNGFHNVVTASRQEVDLRQYSDVSDFFHQHKPDIVFFAAGRVGGIQANINYPVEFLCDNFLMTQNILRCCNDLRPRKVVIIGSSCMYPKDSMQPMKEEYILSGKPEPTNEAFAIAKLAGLKLSEYYHKQYNLPVLNVIPCNLYGTNDHYDLDNSHVISALIMKFSDAREMNSPRVVLWGRGIARREFMHVDDFAGAVLFLLEKWQSAEFINVGTGGDISVRELAELVADKTGFKGEIVWDTEKPDGMLRKCLDVSKLRQTGYNHRISLSEGIQKTIVEYKAIKKGKL